MDGAPRNPRRCGQLTLVVGVHGGWDMRSRRMSSAQRLAYDRTNRTARALTTLDELTEAAADVIRPIDDGVSPYGQLGTLEYWGDIYRPPRPLTLRDQQAGCAADMAAIAHDRDTCRILGWRHIRRADICVRALAAVLPGNTRCQEIQLSEAEGLSASALEELLPAIQKSAVWNIELPYYDSNWHPPKIRTPWQLACEAVERAGVSNWMRRGDSEGEELLDFGRRGPLALEAWRDDGESPTGIPHFDLVVAELSRNTNLRTIDFDDSAFDVDPGLIKRLMPAIRASRIEAIRGASPDYEHLEMMWDLQDLLAPRALESLEANRVPGDCINFSRDVFPSGERKAARERSALRCFDTSCVWVDKFGDDEVKALGRALASNTRVMHLDMLSGSELSIFGLVDFCEGISGANSRVVRVFLPEVLDDERDPEAEMDGYGLTACKAVRQLIAKACCKNGHRLLSENDPELTEFYLDVNCGPASGPECCCNVFASALRGNTHLRKLTIAGLPEASAEDVAAALLRAMPDCDVTEVVVEAGPESLRHRFQNLAAANRSRLDAMKESLARNRPYQRLLLGALLRYTGRPKLLIAPFFQDFFRFLSRFPLDFWPCSLDSWRPDAENGRKMGENG